jgi:hypothetical protein
MKRSFVALAIVVSAIALVRPAYAQQESTEPIITERHEASTLITQPATINSAAGNAIDRTNNLRQIADSIGRVNNEGGCKNVKPVDFLNDPDAVIKECEKRADNETPQRHGDPVDYLKVPRLDSGVKLTVTQF